VSGRRGQVFVISGPSGVGKDAVIEKLVAADPLLERSVSYTTRRPRPGEQDGVAYSFETREEFQKLIDRGELLEHATYDGNFYGTSARRVEELRAAGHDVILKIDVKGAEQVRKLLPDATFIFLAPPSMEELIRRTALRQTESAEERSARQVIAETEMKYAPQYDYTVVNDKLDRAVADVLEIIRGVRSRQT
jgi:guanylate kinase